MIDTSNFTLDTPVYISIMTPGYYIPELSTYTPLKVYTKIENVITIMNRGIKVEFPRQEKREISEKIEDILLEYEEKKQKLKKKYGDVGSNVDKALETIQEINDSKITKEEQRIEDENHIFEYDDVINRVVSNLRDGVDSRLVEMLSNSSGDRLEKEQQERKAKERIALKRKEALELVTLETESLRKIAQAGQFTDAFDERFDDIQFDAQTTTIPKGSKK